MKINAINFIKIIIFLGSFLSLPSYAYLGPGVGGGFFIGIIGLLVGIIVAIIAIIWYPLKKLYKKISRKN